MCAMRKAECLINPVCSGTSHLVGAIAEAQQAGKVARIGFLDTSTASGSAVLVNAFRQELPGSAALGKEYHHRVPVCGGKRR